MTWTWARTIANLPYPSSRRFYGAQVIRRSRARVRRLGDPRSDAARMRLWSLIRRPSAAEAGLMRLRSLITRAPARSAKNEPSHAREGVAGPWLKTIPSGACSGRARGYFYGFSSISVLYLKPARCADFMRGSPTWSNAPFSFGIEMITFGLPPAAMAASRLVFR